MDKVEYKIKYDEIKSLVDMGAYQEAVEIADEIDWRKVKSVKTLCMISDIYKINRRYEDARNIMILAYEKNPGSRTIVFNLCELSIKIGDLVMALEYCKEYAQLAPHDIGKHILTYKMYKAQGVSLEEQISILEELKSYEYREKWAYELAYLYHRVGLDTKCVQECDDIFLWFGEGKYVIQALELKKLHTALTPQQQVLYDHRFDSEVVEEEAPVDAVEQAEVAEENQEDAAVAENDENMDILSAPTTRIPVEEIQYHIQSYSNSPYDTINLQQEIADGIKPYLENGEVSIDQFRFGMEPELDDNNTYYEPAAEEDNFAYEPATEDELPKELENALSMESDGQISLVVPEPSVVEKQITGQMNIEDILKEWEDIKNRSREKSIQDMHRKVSESTGQMFDEYEASIRDGLLEKIEKGEYVEGLIIPEDTVEEPVQEANNEDDFYQEDDFLKNPDFAYETEDDGVEEIRTEDDLNRSAEEAYEELPAEEVVPEGADVVLENKEAAEGTIEGNAQLTEEITAEDDQYAESGEHAEEGYVEENGEYTEEGYVEENGEYTEEGYVEENGEYTEEGYVEENGEYTEEGYVEENGEYTEEGYVEENGEYTEEGYVEENGEYTEEGYVEENGEYAEGGYVEENGEYAEGGYVEENGEYAEGGYVEENSEYAETSEEISEEVPAEEISEEVPAEETSVEETQEETIEEEPVDHSEAEMIVDYETREIPLIDESDLQGEKIRALTPEEEDLFRGYVDHPRARKMLTTALDAISLAPYTGNVIITGDDPQNCFRLTKCMIKDLQAADANFNGKIGKVSGKAMNGKNVVDIFDGLKSGALIIQGASAINDETADAMYKALQHDSYGILIIVEDTRKAMKHFMEKHPDLAECFTSRMEVRSLSDKDLVKYGIEYAKEQEYVLDEMGLLEFHTLVTNRQTSDHLVSKAEVREIIDQAVQHAKRISIGHFFDIIFARRYDENDMVILRAKDFKGID